MIFDCLYDRTSSYHRLSQFVPAHDKELDVEQILVDSKRSVFFVVLLLGKMLLLWCGWGMKERS